MSNNNNGSSDKNKADMTNLPEITNNPPNDETRQNFLEVNNSPDLTNNAEQEILDTVANSSAIFKSQQKDEPELLFHEKRKIAEDLLKKNHHQFLSRFGKSLKPHLLDYFTEKSGDYETTYHVSKLRRFLNVEMRRIDRKNRRYEAWKEMIQKGEYFSETAMMKRNPLLYEHLVGRFLTEEQKKARDNVDTTNITFVNLLLEGIEREGVRDLKKAQEEAEEEVLEENDSDSDDGKGDLGGGKKGDNNWGEIDKENGDVYEGMTKERRNLENHRADEIDYEEQQVLRQEFISQMYESFLEGRDTDFDYSAVDDNEAYDNVELREQDEEEKYFDAESPEVTIGSSQTPLEGCDDSEDELDKYMRSLKESEEAT
ncbi:coiled-coil domain-containing protein 97 isoform X2 [Diachasmimorpha longicaudata]|uniref:coiled-coil domain-containing protein 97 isoform X2 n=1 Tax=Diachasmimorpha longicaudata TaxID=58733 RepID=UPI0030B8A453